MPKIKVEFSWMCPGDNKVTHEKTVEVEYPREKEYTPLETAILRLLDRCPDSTMSAREYFERGRPDTGPVHKISLGTVDGFNESEVIADVDSHDKEDREREARLTEQAKIEAEEKILNPVRVDALSFIATGLENETVKKVKSNASYNWNKVFTIVGHREWIDSVKILERIGLLDRVQQKIDELNKPIMEEIRLENEKREAEKERREKEEKDAEIRRDEEIVEWAKANGSERLRAQLANGYDGWPRYLHERILHLLGLSVDGDLKENRIFLKKDAKGWETKANPTREELAIELAIADLLVRNGQHEDINKAVKNVFTVVGPEYDGYATDEDGHEDPEDWSGTWVRFSFVPGKKENGWGVKTVVIREDSPLLEGLSKNVDVDVI